MRPLLPVLAVATALGSLIGALPAGAVAERSTVVASPRFVPAAGPILAGEGRVVWVTRRDDRVLDLWVVQPGEGPRRVQRYSGSDGEQLRLPRLSASASEVTLELSQTRASRVAGAERIVASRLYRGAFGEPLRPVEPGGARERLTYADVAGRSAWVTRACASAEIRVGILPVPKISSAVTAPAGATRPCPLRLRSPAVVRGGRLRLGVSCAGLRIACAAEVTVRAGRLLVARGPARYNHGTPPYAAADLRLTGAGARLLRRGRRIHVRITARIHDATSPAIVRSTSRTIATSRRPAS